MTQRSYFWDGTTVGHAAHAPYSDTDFMRALMAAFQADREYGGIISKNYLYGDGFTVTKSGTSITIGEGSAIVEGRSYNVDSKTFSLQSSLSSYYYYTIVLRCNYAAKTITMELIGPSSVTYPSITQTATVWDVPFAHLRKYLTSAPDVYMYVRRTVVPSGHGIVPFIKRQSGHANDWGGTGGSSNYDANNSILVECGVARWTGGAASSGNVGITFVTNFKYVPILFVTPVIIVGEAFTYKYGTAATVTTAGATLYWEELAGSNKTIVDLNWVAFGPKAW